jgi:hypothetical protein
VLRLAVSHNLEKALKVDHLTTVNPLKAKRKDFIPPSAMRWIEDAAKRNLDLSWALDQSLGKASFSGRRPENASRGGKTDYARQRGVCWSGWWLRQGQMHQRERQER